MPVHCNNMLKRFRKCLFFEVHLRRDIMGHCSLLLWKEMVETIVFWWHKICRHKICYSQKAEREAKLIPRSFASTKPCITTTVGNMEQNFLCEKKLCVVKHDFTHNLRKDTFRHILKFKDVATMVEHGNKGKTLSWTRLQNALFGYSSLWTVLETSNCIMVPFICQHASAKLTSIKKMREENEILNQPTIIGTSISAMSPFLRYMHCCYNVNHILLTNIANNNLV